MKIPKQGFEVKLDFDEMNAKLPADAFRRDIFSLSSGLRTRKFETREKVANDRMHGVETEDPEVSLISLTDSDREFMSGELYILNYYGLRIGFWLRSMEGEFPEGESMPEISGDGVITFVITDIGMTYTPRRIVNKSLAYLNTRPLSLHTKFRSATEQAFCLELIKELFLVKQIRDVITHDEKTKTILLTYVSPERLPYQVIFSPTLEAKLARGLY